ncbi:MAG TPA: lysophospholipid acyltransferase family protein [Candidatus Binatus sp.]|nr:lysophospholipid acyltransferase family protein [Candidatus Binatus sp.]
MTRWYEHRFHNLTAQRIIFAIIPRLPRFVHPPIAVVTALIFFVMLRRERRAVAGNLRRVSGKHGLALQWKVYWVFYSFCDLMVSYCYVPQATHAELRSMLVDPERGGAKIEQCLAAGNGLIVWTAHVGNWEFASRLLEMHGRPVNVARVVEDKPAEILLRNLMASERLRIVDLREGVSATLELLQALRRNEIVAMQGDRVYQRHSAEVPFFSQPTSFPLGPFLLSQVSGAPVMPGFVIRQGWLRYHAMMGDPISPPPSQSESQVASDDRIGDRIDDRDAGLREALLVAVQFLEKTLANHYDQWMNFFDFWRVASRD